MKPECHVSSTEEECYLSSVEVTKAKGTHIECQLSKEDIGNLLQGKAIELLFLNSDCALEGMIDIKLSDTETNLNVSDKLNNMILDNGK